jgi:hypothetical protein
MSTLSRRAFLPTIAATAAALTVGARPTVAIVPPADNPDRWLRSWEVLRPVPALGLVTGDHVTDWAGEESLPVFVHRRREMYQLPAGSWPRVLEAWAAGAVEVNPLSLPKAIPPHRVRRLLALVGPARTAAIIHRVSRREQVARYARVSRQPVPILQGVA